VNIKGLPTSNLCNQLSATLIFASIIFAPWAFGTVHNWAIQCLNWIGYSLGFLLATKAFLRRRSLRQGTPYFPLQTSKRIANLTSASVVFTLILILIHGVNARASFDASTLLTTYYDSYIPWLPHSFNRENTFPVFWKFLALACFYFATRDWLLSSTKKERNAATKDTGHQDRNSKNTTLSQNLKFLLLIISINGGLLALEAIFQRLDGTNRLLWIYEPQIIKYAPWQFGPFAYRGNASAYFNLVWPLTLFLILNLKTSHEASKRHPRLGTGPHHALFPILGLILICPIVTTSRAGTLVSLLTLFGVGIYLILKAKKRTAVTLTLILTMLFLGGIAHTLGANKSLERVIDTVEQGFSPKGETRFDIYQPFPTILKNTPFWGYGPGSFSSTYFLFRKTTINPNPNLKASKQRNDTLIHWPAWAHCDPFEFYITFGPIGFLLLITFLCSALYPNGRAKRNQRPPTYLLLPAISIAGFSVHSLVDFPFQVYSLSHLFIITLAIISSQPKTHQG
jgi:hypothetical protein